MLIPHHSTIALVAGLCALLLAPAPAAADPDPIIQTCYNTGCSNVFSILAPCGGGATNSSLQQNLIYTPTPSLGGCECNYQFYTQFSSCLSCIASQGQSNPEIQDQQDWINNCASYGFNYTNTPVTNSTNGNNGTTTGSGSGASGSSGLSTGAIVGIVLGALALLALIGACFFLRGRKRKQEKAALFDQPDNMTTAGGPGIASGALAGAAATTAASNFHNTDYPASYDHQDDYYANQQAYGDPSAQQYNSNQYSAYPGQQPYPSDHQNGGYYGADGSNDAMMMQNLDHSHVNGNGNVNGGVYVPPPPHPASNSHTTAAAAAVAAAAGAAAYSTSPRPSDTFPQSLRSKPKGWDNNNNQEFSSGLASTDPSQHNDKTEFDEGEDLEPPHSLDRFANDRDDFTTRRSMTPPRATMQSYRDEFSRPSFEPEPRRSGSDRGSFSGMNLVRGGDSSNNLYGDYDQPRGEDGSFGRASQDSPESARRRARAAELFSAEGTRR